MFSKIIILTLSVTFVKSNYLETETTFQKPKLERNNIVNKGVWIRNKFKENLFEKGRIGDFIFRENSLDVDNLLQNNFDAFGANYMQDSPLVSAYVKRTKRATRIVREQRPRKSIIKNCNGIGCKNINIENQSSPISEIARPKFGLQNKPASVFNDYPYEVAILLNNKSELEIPKNDTQPFENDIEKNVLNLKTNNDNIQDTGAISINAIFKNNETTPRNSSTPKRSMKYDFESEIIKKFEFTEDVNKTEENNENNDSKVMDRNIFDKDNTVWHQNAPLPDINVYKVVPKEPQKSKPVTERGLIKVISMLTKTFKKIMKQHNEIKDIHNRISDVNDEFVKNAATITTKFQDFDLKYLYLLKFHEKLKLFDAKLATKQEYFKNKEREMARSFKEFENQQKKFLQQQRQFYNIQKMMLAQNEKINLKQNLIAKTQSEISHRQNNFARILKKAKQLYIESKNPGTTKLSSGLTKPIHNQKSEPKVTHTSTTNPPTESVKINLFSIPVSNKIENQDDLILKEKDEQTIDDLVYKYYFNNTFIDNLMKSNVLSNVMGSSDSSGHSRNVKSKRGELETTLLLPVFESNDSEAIVTKNRERRWINHHSRHNSKRRNRGKGATIVNATDEKSYRKKKTDIPEDVDVPPKEVTKDDRINNKNDPFLTMATNFCIEIRQNLNAQKLRWCIEKALRRLQFLDMKTLPNSDLPATTPQAKPLNIPTNTKLNTMNSVYTELYTAPITAKVVTTPSSVSVTKINPSIVIESTVSPSTQTTSTQATTQSGLAKSSTKHFLQPDGVAFFPDNEELESNLKQFDTKPDIEGNVYFEGSVHASEILDSESQGIDDIIPGLESNSRVDMDPLAFDLQAKRRAFVRKLNEKIKMSLG